MLCLVVDDEATARAMLAMYLEDYGAVASAEDGEQALTLIEGHLSRQHPFHLICVDLSMPGIDGLDLVEQIRSVEARFDAGYTSRIVVVSASDHALDVIGAFRNQADGYLHKPIHPDRLDAMLSSLHLLPAPVETAP